MQRIRVTKPTYYLWKSPHCPQEELTIRKELLRRCGFRVVIYADGTENRDIRYAIKSLIRNHWKDL